ncbi:thioesterase II family protein [Nocardia asteroides]|uniref:thioesterase II family protein n=1 Tax=Nocardia asteroides TaxID=1824 RepID=UPI001E57D29C|nr:alpha/beta fold hydrolase [Nocardia asteroides]UGT59962.1 thioesterase domain-containing protein [Nocardia asteroides]
MAIAPGWIRKFHKPRSADATPLVICPHAGGGAATYRPFSKALSANFDVGLLQYPGRQDRGHEPVATSIEELAAGAFAEYRGSPLNTGAPLTVFGHSMGTMVAFEFTRLAERAGLPVRLLGVSGAVAPWQVAEMPAHPTEDEELLDHLSGLDGTGAEVLGNRELMRMSLPALKADYAAFDAYTCDKDVTVSSHIHAMGGSDDEFVTIGHLYSWQQHSDREIEVSLFDGGHFYLHDHVADIAEALTAEPGDSR